MNLNQILVAIISVITTGEHDLTLLPALVAPFNGLCDDLKKLLGDLQGGFSLANVMNLFGDINDVKQFVSDLEAFVALANSQIGSAPSANPGR